MVFLRLPVFLVFVLILSACSEETPQGTEITFSGPTMGTTFHVKIIDLPNEIEAEKIKEGIGERLEDVNNKMSLWVPDSELMLLNQSNSTEWQSVSEDLFKVTKAAQDISQMSDGYFDVTLEPLIKIWGFSTKDAIGEPPADDAVQTALNAIGYEKLLLKDSPHAIQKTDPNLSINLSAIAKGFGIDQIAEFLDSLNLKNYMVEIGGDLRAKGTNSQYKPWRIAIEKPEYFNRSVYRIIDLDGAGMATSGDYRNYYEKDGKRFSHIIDPNTGYPITHKLASVTVLSDNAMMADGLATALLSMGDEKGFEMAEVNQIAAFFIIRDGETFIEKKTSHFDAFIHTSDATH